MQRRGRSSAASFFMMFAASCGAGCAGTYRSPTSGGVQWHEASSAHFRVRTDLGAEQARARVFAYERTYSFLKDVAFASADAPAGVTDVVVFANEEEYREVAPRLAAGYFTQRGGAPYEPRPTIVVGPRRDLTAVHHLFQHELVHRFVTFHFPGAPIWLQEGLAQFYETLRFEGTAAIFGEVPKNMAFSSRGWLMWDYRGWRPLSRLPPTTAVRSLSRPDFYAANVQDEALASSTRSAHYLSAWAQTHVMALGPSDLQGRFTGYLNSLKAGEQQAWHRNFDSASLQKLEQTYAAFLERRKTASGRVAAPSPPTRATSRTVQPWEVHYMWAAIRRWDTKPERERARRDIDMAIELNPKGAAGYLLRAAWWRRQGDTAQAARDLRRGLELEPSNRTAQRLWGIALLREQLAKPVEERSWMEAAKIFYSVRINVQTASDWIALALYEGIRRRFDRAIPYAARAARLDSSCWECYWVSGELQLAKGDAPAAVAALRIADGLAGEQAPRFFHARLREVEATAEHCQQAAEGCGPRVFDIPWL